MIRKVVIPATFQNFLSETGAGNCVWTQDAGISAAAAPIREATISETVGPGRNVTGK
jgi:hypothetical protein